MESARIGICCCLLLVASAARADSDGWTPLFDGQTLDGWEVLPGGEWSVVDGTIVGSQEADESRHGQLLSVDEYGDFEARVSYRATEGNSGFYFRVEKTDHYFAVKGFQAEIDSNGDSCGGLYETLGREWVARPPTDAYRPGEWNDMTVTAKGGDITVTLNGVETARLTDDPGARRGRFGLQLHGGMRMRVEFKDIAVRSLDD